MSQEYVINGDLWDYLFDECQTSGTDTVFMPLTLEMGSWSWLRKSPMHLFLRHGLFHPLLPHRQQRILRRHLTLFDFLSRAALYLRIPAQSCHLIQTKAATHSISKLPPIPVKSATPLKFKF
jgi:hypothetical protein